MIGWHLERATPWRLVPRFELHLLDGEELVAWFWLWWWGSIWRC